MATDRAIILAAGKSFQLDGINKVLTRHPHTGKSILEHAIEAFSGKKITVVVGFRAIQIMEQFPHLDYVINSDWALTNNAMSLGLALTDEPTYVVSGDIFFTKSLIEELDAAEDNIALTENRENRTLTAINCILDDNNHVVETYQGPIRDMRHPEAIGLFKISDKSVLREWKQRSVNYGNLFVGQTLPTDKTPISIHPVGNHEFCEINTAADYLRLIQQYKATI